MNFNGAIHLYHPPQRSTILGWFLTDRARQLVLPRMNGIAYSSNPLYVGKTFRDDLVERILLNLDSRSECSLGANAAFLLCITAVYCLPWIRTCSSRICVRIVSSSKVSLSGIVLVNKFVSTAVAISSFCSIPVPMSICIKSSCRWSQQCDNWGNTSDGKRQRWSTRIVSVSKNLLCWCVPQHGFGARRSDLSPTQSLFSSIFLHGSGDRLSCR